METTGARTSGPCDCGRRADQNQRLVAWTTAAGMLVAIALCAAGCLLPAILITFGVAGAWVGALESLAPYKAPLALADGMLLAYGFFATYWRPRYTREGATAPPSGFLARAIRIGLWMGATVAISGIVYGSIEARSSEHRKSGLPPPLAAGNLSRRHEVSDLTATAGLRCLQLQGPVATAAPHLKSSGPPG